MREALGENGGQAFHPTPNKISHQGNHEHTIDIPEGVTIMFSSSIMGNEHIAATCQVGTLFSSMEKCPNNVIPRNRASIMGSHNSYLMMLRRTAFAQILTLRLYCTSSCMESVFITKYNSVPRLSSALMSSRMSTAKLYFQRYFLATKLLIN